MRLISWDVEGYKSLEEEGIELSDINILIGKNNSGKSNLLNSFRDYQRLFTDIGNMGWFGSEITRRESILSTRFTARFELSASEQLYLQNELSETDIADEWFEDGFSEIEHQLAVDRNGTLIEDAVWVDIDDEMVQVLWWDDGTEKSINWNQLPDEKKYSGHAGTGVVRGLSDPYLELLDSSISSWNSVDSFRRPEDTLPSRYTQELESDGSNLIQVLDTLDDNRPEKFEQIAATYVDIMEGVMDVETPFVGSEGSSSTTIAIQEDAFSERFNAEDISAGSKEILTLITQIYLSEEETDLLLIEEPELHLHPEAEQEVFDIITDIADADGPQVLISTHSDVFVNQSEANNIIRVEREGVTTLRRVKQGEIDQELADLGYSKSGLLQSDAVVFVEGLSDKLILSQWAATLGLDIESEGISIVELEGEGNVETHGRSLVKLLHSFDIPYLFVVDSDEDDAKTVVDEYKRTINREDDNVDESSIWWYTTPDHFHAWQHSDIEYFLLQAPGAIADVVNESVERIRQIIEDSQPTAEKNVDVLDEIWEQCYVDPDGVTSYQKDIDGKQIATHMTEDHIEDEIRDVIEQIQALI